ncbi:hypothetical protein [Chitinophaga sp. Cy-1792]|uniref:hypothetical protein n=1 Tax=Chitinophaga sp. Cy-1792 TaxID=2608339 RepID=UPI0014202CF0|nr:hypothetical protein [Chitinophaga sp. Cy-1792]NIG53937.1 hypothetical protein [Chitinophaga sp. Cy-1792]
MKPISYSIMLAGILALGACSSAYKTASTPDDVYYSPRQRQQTQGYATNNPSNGNTRQDDNTFSAVPASEDDGGTYVTYSDEQGDYERRLDRFGGGGSSYSGNYMDGYNAGYVAGSNMSYSMSMGYGYGGYGMGYGYPYSSFGYGYSPYWGSSLSLGFGWGMGGYYNPWYYGGGWPYYSYYPYYGYGYGYPYYGHGYYGGGGYYGHGAYYSRSNYVPVNRVNNFNRPDGSGGVPRPSRGGYQPVYSNTGNGSGYSRPSRVNYQPSNTSNGTSNGSYTAPSTDRPRRVFQQSGSERPVYQNSNSNSGNNSGYSRPSRTEYSRPQSQPSYSQPSYSAPSGGGGGGRVNSGGGGGGGYSRPSRGGR